MKKEKVDEIVERFSKRIVPKDWHKHFHERPIVDTILGIIFLLLFCLLWFLLVGMPVIYFTSKHL